MLPKYGKNYYVISQLQASTVNIDVIFPQNAYPAQHFIVQVPENGFREFTLAKTDNKFSLYDLQQHFSLPAGNTEEEDHIPGGSEISKIAAVSKINTNKDPIERSMQPIPATKEPEIVNKPVIPVSTPVITNTVSATSANEPVFIDNIELNNQHPIVQTKKEVTLNTQPVQYQEIKQETKPLNKPEPEKAIIPSAQIKVATTEEVPQHSITKKAISDQEAVNEFEKHPYTRKVTIEEKVPEEENYHIVQIAQKPIEEKVEEPLVVQQAQQDVPMKGYYDDQGNFISEAPVAPVKTKQPNATNTNEQNYSVQIAKRPIAEEKLAYTNSRYSNNDNEGNTTEHVVTKRTTSNMVIDPETHQPISTSQSSGSSYEESYTYTKTAAPITTGSDYEQSDYIAENRPTPRRSSLEETTSDSYKECTKPMDSYTFNELFKSMTQQDDPERKMVYIIKSINDHCFSTAQLRMLAQAMDNERRRYAILKKAYDHTTDKDNFPTLSSLFYADEWKTLFHQIMLQ